MLGAKKHNGADFSRCTQGGANSGLRAYGIGQVVEAPQAKRGATAGDVKAVLKRFWRPEEVSRDASYKASFREVGCWRLAASSSACAA